MYRQVQEILSYMPLQMQFFMGTQTCILALNFTNWHTGNKTLLTPDVLHFTVLLLVNQ